MRAPSSELPVPVDLAPWVARASLSTYDGPPQTLTDPPEAAVTLAVRWSADGTSDLVVAGPRSRAVYYRAESGPACLRFRMRPGWLPPDLASARELVDHLLPVGKGAADLPQALLAADDGWDPAHGALEEAARLLARGDQVAVVAGKVGISERQLRELFGRRIGLSPKHLARVARVRAVADALEDDATSDFDLVGLAGATGYYDQAHMTTEFRRHMGITPAAFAAGHRPPPTPCTSPVTGSSGNQFASADHLH